MSFQTRYKKLNTAQAEAVDTIDGPLMVVAGPGTGKTELLSMRTANILNKTDTSPENILCLTFTESGARAMRERLIAIIGTDAYKVAIHTFHSFGNEIMNQYAEYFYSGASFQAASDITIYETMRAIFDDLSHNNPLSSMMNGEYTYLKDVIQSVSELKRSGLTSDELITILEDNERVIDAVEAELGAIFAERSTKNTVNQLAPIALRIAELPDIELPAAITPLSGVLAISMSRMIDEAHETNSTKPVTAWRNQWFEKNMAGSWLFKDRKRVQKLRVVSYIYQQYLSRLQEKSLFDFDDMVLGVVHALEVIDELRFNLQERYLYVMVDEFQDTNFAQSRLLRSLASNPANEGAPNLMVVGDDDQAIYSFQGAEISNILQFKGLYESTKLITLTENYRSSDPILTGARAVIIDGSDRLENFIPELDKSLVANHKGSAEIQLQSYNRLSDERNGVIRAISKQLTEGAAPDDIVVIARRHHELVSLLPYFASAGIAVNYERRENVLESEVVVQLELLARIIQAIADRNHDLADTLLPELLAHEAWAILPTDLWKLSLDAYKKRQGWMEYLSESETYRPLHAWLCASATLSKTAPLEQLLDTLTGINETGDAFRSPLFDHYFKSEALEDSPDSYIRFLDALRTLRDRLREHANAQQLSLADFIEYIDLHRSLGTVISSVTSRSNDSLGRVQLMTAHKSKGLEFDHVHIFGAVDSSWGEKVRTRSRLISFPENLPLTAAGDSYDERLRLFYVAMTRAKDTLTISYSQQNDTGAGLLPASFLDKKVGTMQEMKRTETYPNIDEARREWFVDMVVSPSSAKELLTPVLESYKLSATHFNTFLDVTRGGPQYFLRHNLLRFPQSMGPNAAYGSAIHRTLQQAHSHLTATKKRKPVEDILHDFDTNLRSAPMLERDFDTFLKRGTEYLQMFFASRYDTFIPEQRSELNFANQHSMLGEAHLTGSLDLVLIDKTAKTIAVTDYKTGKPSTNWKGKTDAEKIKLHKYRQQLMFYKLLVEHSRDYGNYTVDQAYIQYVEPAEDDTLYKLSVEFESEELAKFSRLVQAVWKQIISLDLPDITEFSTDYKGILAFEQSLLSE